jgi:hypothetical protein
MNDLSPTPDEFEEDHYPLRAGDWLVRGSENRHIAQVKAIHLDLHGEGGKREFLVDLWLYDTNGYRIGRESPNEPFTIGDKTYRGPRTYEPSMPLGDDWRRIEKPEFPLKREWISYPDPKKPGWSIHTSEYPVKPRPWGNYGRRVKKPAPVVAVSKPNFDPELEKRARLMAAQLLRDAARETGVEALKVRAAELEKEAEAF